MSVEQITTVRYKCKCEATNKKGEIDCAHEWEADEIPPRCAKCKRYTWNRPALRAGKHPKEFTAFGKSQTLSTWGREYTISPATIAARINSGWTVEDAIALPIRKKFALEARNG